MALPTELVAGAYLGARGSSRRILRRTQLNQAMLRWLDTNQRTLAEIEQRPARRTVVVDAS
jgi:hypothetical protein